MVFIQNIFTEMSEAFHRKFTFNIETYRADVIPKFAHLKGATERADVTSR